MPDNPPHDRNNTARRDFICLVQAEVESSATRKYEKASFINFVSSKEGMDLSKYAVNGATIMDLIS